MSNKKQLTRHTATSVHLQQSYSGPIPQADQMSQYADIDPTFPQKIMDMALKEQQHRFDKEKSEQQRANEVIRTNAFLAKCGIFSAVGCVFLVMLAAVLCAFAGQTLPATIIGGGGLAVIVTVLVTGSRLNPNK